jgi:predicted MPP superfamily phosphohydrolase
LILGYAWLIEPNWLEVTRHDAWFPALPPEFDGLVVAHLSDLHISNYGFRERRVVKLLADANPGLIAITGDVSVKGRDPAPIQRFLKELQSLHITFGVWAVPGNHEHTGSPAQTDEALRRFFTEAGIALLINEGGRIGRGLDTLSLIGVDDPYSGHDKLGAALKGMQRTPFAVLLSHSPEIFMKADLAHFDLVLAGHTHGGQVRLPWIGALWVPDGSEAYEAGWFSGLNAKMYVTRGIGTSILPIRFLCRPEIALITLKRGKPT